MLVEAAASSLSSMLLPVVDDILVRVRRGMVSHWSTILFFLRSSLDERKRLHKNFVSFVDNGRVGGVRAWSTLWLFAGLSGGTEC